MRPQLLPFLLLPALACARGERTGTPADSSTATPGSAADSAAARDTVAILERTPCFGICPVYRLTFTADGHGVLQGMAPTASFRTEVHASRAGLMALLDQMEQGGFFALDSAYIPGHPLCAQPATDHPGSVLLLRRGGRRHEVRFYHGCYPAPAMAEAPAELQRLRAWEDALDSLAGTARWVDSLRGR